MRRFAFLFICLLLCRYASAEPGASRYIADLNNAKSDSGKVAAYQAIIRHYSVRQPDSALFYSEQGIAWCKRKKYPLGEGMIITQLAVIDNGQGRTNIARQRFLYAMEIYKELNYKPGIADLLGNLGALEATKGNFDVGVKYIFASLRLHESLGDNHGLMIGNMNIGSIYLQQGDTTNATKYLTIAEDVSKKIPVVDKTIALYNMIGVLNAVKGNTAKALEYFLNDLKISDNPKFINSHVECLLYLGNFYHDAGDMPTALKYLQEGLKIATDKKLPEVKSNLLLEIAAMIRERDPAMAMTYVKEAEAIAIEMDNRSFLVTVYGDMAAISKQLGKFEAALQATERKQKISDSIFSINRAREMASITATYELEKTNLKVKELQGLSRRNATQRNLVVVVACCIAILLGILFVFYRKTRRLNVQLKVHEEELRALNSTKDKFFSIIGHDLRSPIARVPVILDLLEDKNTTPEEKQYLLDNMREHSRVSMEMLDKLLFWGQSLVKGIRIQQQNIFLDEYIRENIALKKMTAMEKHINIVDKVPGDLKVYADATHCDFIVRNLLANAIKYTHENGKIEIAADNSSRPGFTVFSVKDDGVGIDQDMQASIFSPLYSMEGTANEKGTGIGLMLCKEFVLQNGGDIWVESELGKGSSFYFSLKNAA